MTGEAGKRVDGFLKATSSYFTLLGPDGHLIRWLIPAGMAISGAVAARASLWLAPFGQIGWILAGLLCGILAALLLLLIEKIRLSRAKRLSPEAYSLPNLDDRANWARGLSIMTIRDTSCAIAGVLPHEFEKSGRANAVAVEIQSRVNDGWVPIDTETSERSGGMVVEIVGRPNFEKKTVDLTQPLYVRDVKRYCSRENWDFSWVDDSAPAPQSRGTVTIGQG